MTNFVVTSIKGIYVEIVKNYEKAIEYKKIRLPNNSRYIDYSKKINDGSAHGTPELYGAHISNDQFYIHWGYNEKNGYWSNSSSKGSESTLTVEDYTGDYTSMGYSDEIYEAMQYHGSGKHTNDSKYGPYDSISTSGLNRFYTSWEDRPNSVYARIPGFMWSKYFNDKFGSLYWIMGTMTLPINTVLWAGASGSTLHSYQWQSDANGNWNGCDATTALKRVTQAACEKLKQEHGDNLRIYLIKYRKQTQYKHPVTGEAVDFDYDYLDYCASPRNADSMSDESEEIQKNKCICDIYADEPSEAKEKLGKALKAVAEDIKKWAGYEDAKNVN
jgi:hypothetical protein